MTEGVRVEAATQSDLDQLVALDARGFSPSDRYPRDDWVELLNESLSTGPAKILVARSSLTVIGAVVVITNLNAEDTNVLSLAVDQEYRRGHVATRLLYEALALQTSRIRTVSLEVRKENTGARAMYEKLGFRVVRCIPGYYADGATALDYRGQLGLVREACRAGLYRDN